METVSWQQVNQVLASLRSTTREEQCESVVRIPATLEECPFPILVDAAFQKLADMFRSCNDNFIRLCILRVMLTTTEHHSKINSREVRSMCTV